MAAGDVLFAATGITDGSLFAGVRFGRGTATTFSIVTRSETGTQRWVRAKHRNGEEVAARYPFSQSSPVGKATRGYQSTRGAEAPHNANHVGFG